MTRSVVHPARLATRVAVVVALIATVSSVAALPAEAVTRPQSLYHERPVTAGPVEPGFPIDHVGVVFDLPPGADVHHDHEDDDVHAGTNGLAVRFRSNGAWGPWEAMTEDGAQAVGRWTGALVAAGDAEAYQVRGVPAFARNVRAAAINTTDGPEEVIGHRRAGSAEAVTTCKSRFDWGANESLRSSTRSYAPVQIMTVHHTATQNDDPEPAARVRAIYEYHVKTNGWDDIGYQALIGEDGTVYEGRWSGSDSPSCVSGGGTGWEFGHAGTTADADVVIGAHTGGYNTGNFGVALLGTLSTTAPKAAARDALVEYLAELAERHAIDPTATVHYDNGTNSKTVPTISAHRDFTATECPGGALYADLPAIRTDVAAAMAAEPVDPGTTPSDPGTTPSDPGTTPSGDAVATGEQAVTGTVSGSYLDTNADGGAAQTITEIESGGKPQQRHSLLEHVWTVPVTGGTSVTLHVDATATASGDGDGFAFAYSVDGGTTYATALTVPAGGAGAYSAALPASTAGEVRVRVTDTNRAKGSRTLDAITVDHLFIRSDSTATTTEPTTEPAPEPATTIALGTEGYKVKGVHHVTLTWSGASLVRVFRDGVAVADVAGSEHVDVAGGTGNGSYRHRVCALDSTGAVGACSGEATTTFS